MEIGGDEVSPGAVLRHATVRAEVTMESVSQREMRNKSGELLRRIAGGESVLVTNNGVPAAVLAPVGADARSRLVATGRLRVGAGLDLTALPA